MAELLLPLLIRKNHEGQGPAWANSLFEDNAEYGFGMAVGVSKLRERIAQNDEEAIKENMMSVEL